VTYLLGTYILGAIVTYVFVLKYFLQNTPDSLDFVIASFLAFIALPLYPIWAPLWVLGKLSGLE
jgi:hypothetical protein